ncbi:25894_t:CDS:2 [Gigaspora rosea]|nr:25894_t:CDS:2 [Gigaspora rosea]
MKSIKFAKKTTMMTVDQEFVEESFWGFLIALRALLMLSCRVL